MSEAYEITLRGMGFHTLAGVLPHERQYAQPLEIDVTAWALRGHGIVDYRTLYEKVRGAMDASEVFYLEELAELVASAILGIDAVRQVRVAIRKPHVAIGGPLEYAEVALTRERHA